MFVTAVIRTAWCLFWSNEETNSTSPDLVTRTTPPPREQFTLDEGSRERPPRNPAAIVRALPSPRNRQVLATASLRKVRLRLPTLRDRDATGVVGRSCDPRDPSVRRLNHSLAGFRSPCRPLSIAQDLDTHRVSPVGPYFGDCSFASTRRPSESHPTLGRGTPSLLRRASTIE